ncbi:hypothetical protein YDYSY3_45890 [Paenibacillus chitinolyticus]|uniref:hypothetical protein n=1 Tax=Paenibacillus chitinolyticus TaxID=79263 RepID=UPI0026E4CDC5|nr:hypothetical protein [Paenibacillus chitinolyticus]GKS13589.1 hypothetical protein YDYSY3_45890 [Paenibacillus chitinolyticus]
MTKLNFGARTALIALLCTTAAGFVPAPAVSAQAAGTGLSSFDTSGAGSSGIILPGGPWTARLQATPSHAVPPSSGAFSREIRAQLYDVDKQKVVETLIVTDEIRIEASRWLASIKDIAVQTKIDNVQGVVLKLPLDPPLAINNRWMQGSSNELFLFLDPSRLNEPLLLVFSTTGKPFLFKTSVQVKPFLEKERLLRYLKPVPASG